MNKILLIILVNQVLLACIESRNKKEPQENPTPTQIGQGKALRVEGAPHLFSDDVSLSIQIIGEKIQSFRYKVGSFSEDSCSNEEAYSPELAKGEALAIDLSTLADGPVTLCIIGRLLEGSWMDLKDAEIISWYKKTNGPKPVNEFSATEQIEMWDQLFSTTGNDGLSLNWTGTINERQGYIIAMSTSPFKSQEAILKDTVNYQEGDQVTESISIVYKGRDSSKDLPSTLPLTRNSDYYFALMSYDEGNVYSIPKIVEVIHFNNAFDWELANKPEEQYKGGFAGGMQLDTQGQAQDVFLCRTPVPGQGLILGQLIPDSNGYLGLGRCHMVVEQNGAKQIQTGEALTTDKFSVLRVHRKGSLTWQKVSTANEILEKSIFPGVLFGQQSLLLTPCRFLFNDKYRPGYARRDGIGGCTASSQDLGSLAIGSATTDYELLVFDGVLRAK